jgi:Ca2+-binding RTX toxin-like protein
MALIVGSDGQDNLNGTSADDEMFGRKGDDFIFGLGGNDTIYYDTGIGQSAVGSSTIPDSGGSDIVDGGEGADRLRVYSAEHLALYGRNSDVYPMTFALEKGTDGFAHFVSSQKWDRFDPYAQGTALADVTLKSIESFAYTGSDALAPESGYPVIYSTTDTIVVGDLSGTALTGPLVFNLGSDGEYHNHGEPGDFLDASAAVNIIVALGGDGDDRLIGGAADDELHGDAGNDQLTGGGGRDTMIGGDGSDVYFSDNRYDSIIELAGGGTDVIQTTADYYVLRANVEDLLFTGAGNFVGIGTSAGDHISGGTGNDYLVGLGGDDTLFAGGGSNTLQGGTGDDTYYTSNSGDTLVEFAGDGIDTVMTTLSLYTLRDQIENLTNIGSGTFRGNGNAADNVLTGSTGNDILYGYDGNDTLVGGGGTNNQLIGGTGDDIYLVSQSSDEVVEQSGEGSDLIQVAGVSFVLSANAENMINTGSAAVTLAGNSAANMIRGGSGADHIDGRGGSDALDGGAGNDLLSGGLGDDRLLGGDGGDQLAGGSGADRFVFDVASSTSQDLIQDFTRADGDKIDVSQLLASIGYAGNDAFADGYLLSEGIVAFGSSGLPATRLSFDSDGIAGGAAAISLAVILGSANAISPADFIYA